jgi:hypothetical protein
MNVELILAAVKKAIEQGAVAAPPVQGLSEDENYVRAQVNVGIDPKVLACFVANLRTDPTMAEFDGLFANSPLGTGVRVGLSNVGQLLLAQAIATGDAEPLCADLQTTSKAIPQARRLLWPLPGLRQSNRSGLGLMWCWYRWSHCHPPVSALRP